MPVYPASPVDPRYVAPCPTCGAPVGEACAPLPRGFRRWHEVERDGPFKGRVVPRRPRGLRHVHQERKQGPVVT